MGNYVNKHRTDGKDMFTMMERLLRNTQPVVQPVVQPVIQVDTNSIANAVSQAVSDNLKNIPKIVYNTNINDKIEHILSDEDTNSLSKLADSMVVQRGQNESNFDNLGGIQTNKKDKKEIDNTINLLRNLDD